jgi:hypothetical protein
MSQWYVNDNDYLNLERINHDHLSLDLQSGPPVSHRSELRGSVRLLHLLIRSIAHSLSDNTHSDAFRNDIVLLGLQSSSLVPYWGELHSRIWLLHFLVPDIDFFHP